MALLSKEDITRSEDLPNKILDMNKWWGGEVKIAVFSVGKQLELSEQVKKDPDNSLFYWIVAGCVEPTFTNDDIGLLKSKCQDSVIFLYEEILKLNKQLDSDNTAKNS